ncbi:MAG: divalent-cation tolerance protein CutA [Elusimicrobiota bacterium]|nr:divalent-cation tolerance protein CutA [Elusimicrobiota bacterium]
MSFRVVLATAPRAKADALAKGLVAARLAACASVLPGAVSHYRWEGKVRRDAECLLVIKTRAALFKKLESWVRRHHPYAVPEVLALPVAGGSKPYLAWLAESTR